MSTITRAAVICCCLLVTAGIAQVLKPTKRLADENSLKLSAIVPETFSGWAIDPAVVPIPPSPDVQFTLETIYKEVLSRTYVNKAGDRMMFTIAYGGDQSGALRAHGQDICYLAQGFTIEKLFRNTISLGGFTIPATRMLAVRGQRTEPVTYWFTMGEKVIVTPWDRLFAHLSYGMSGYIPDGMVIRVSNISNQETASFAAHDAFVKVLIDSMQNGSAVRLVGMK